MVKEKYEMKYINFVTCILMTIVVIYTISNYIRCGQNAVDKMSESSMLCQNRRIIFIVLFAVGIFFRVFRFSSIPAGFSQDEAMEAYDAKSLMTYGTDHYGNFLPVHMIAWGDSQQSPVIDYLMIPFIKIFGMNKNAVRVPMLILSIVGMIFFSLLIKEILGEVPGLIALALCAINPWHIVQSRYALDCNVFPHILVIGLYLLIKGVKYRKKSDLYCGIAMLALSHYGYAISAYMIPVFLLIYFIYLLRKRSISLKQFILCIFVYLLVAGPFFATMILNVAGIKSSIRTPLFTIPAFPRTERRSDMLFWSDDIPGQLARNAKEMLNIIFLQQECVPWDSVEHYGTIFRCMVPVAVMGFVYVINRVVLEKNEKTRTGYFLLIVWFIMSVVGGLITNVNGILRRLNVFYYLEIAFAAVGMYCIFLFGRKVLKLSLVIIAMMGMLLFYSYNIPYASEFTSDTAVSMNVLNAIDKMKSYSCSTYYFTPSTLIDDYPKVTEIWVLFEFDIDSHYYRGVSDNSYGKKYNKSYVETFIYQEPEKIKDISPENDAVYLIKSQDKGIFDEDYRCYSYGEFCVEVPKWKE